MFTVELTISTPSYAFRKYIYTKFSTTIGTLSVKSYADSNCPISIINRRVLLSVYPNILIKHMPTAISIRKIGNVIY